MNAVEEAYRLLRNDLYMHLEEAEYLADYDHWSDKQIRAVRGIITNLVTVIRGLVVLHDDRTGKCPRCGTAWPCEEFESIHRLVKAPQSEFVKLMEARKQTI